MIRARRSFLVGLPVIVACLFLGGCKSQDIKEDDYNSSMAVPGAWKISSTGPITVDVDPTGKSVRITGQRSKDRVTGTVVKVEGKLQFNLYDVERVVIGDGAEAFVTNCAEVNARDNTKVHVSSCATVRLKPSAQLIEVNGASNVIRLEANKQGQ